MEREKKQTLYANFEQREGLTTENEFNYEYGFNIIDISYYVDSNGNSEIDDFIIGNLTIFDEELDDCKPIEQTDEIVLELKNLWLDMFYDEIFDDYCNSRENEMYNESIFENYYNSKQK